MLVPDDGARIGHINRFALGVSVLCIPRIGTNCAGGSDRRAQPIGGTLSRLSPPTRVVDISGRAEINCLSPTAQGSICRPKLPMSRLRTTSRSGQILRHNHDRSVVSAKGSAAKLSKMSSLVAAMTVRANIMPNQHSKIPGGSRPQRRATPSNKLSGTRPSLTGSSSRSQLHLDIKRGRCVSIHLRTHSQSRFMDGRCSPPSQ
jgi:hypothetical protein